MTGKWWLVTFGTYGQWLPGDPRGFKTWRKHRTIPQPVGSSEHGGPGYVPGDYTNEYESARKMTGTSVSFTTGQRRQVLDAVANDLEQLPVAPAILAVADVHVHLIAKFGGLKIRPTVGRFRAAATQRLHENGLDVERIWAKGCHMESLPSEDAFVQTFAYIREHEKQGAAVRVWQLEYADDVLPF